MFIDPRYPPDESPEDQEEEEDDIGSNGMA